MATAPLFKASLWLILFNFGIFVDRMHCKNYSNYTLYNMNAQHICSVGNSKPKLEKLGDNNDVIMVDSGYKFQDPWEPKIDLDCKFVVETKKKKDGIFAVVQSANLRKGEMECLDHIQFRRRDLHKTTQFCGKFQVSNPYRNNGSYEGMSSEFDSEGRIETRIFVSSERMDPSVEPLKVKIVYTLYKDCSEVDDKIYRRVLQNTNICILKSYFCDGIFNCAGIDGCLDESDCEYQNSNIVSKNAGTKITVAAVTTIFLCFIIFIMCLYICRHKKTLCWSSDCAGPSERADPRFSIDIEQRSRGSNGVPTAPMLEVAVPPSVHDKDLPPSYDSLFPEESSHANS